MNRALVSFLFLAVALYGADVTPPAVKTIWFTPLSIDTSAAEASILLQAAVTDDLSGVNYFEAVFTSPENEVRRSGNIRIAPAREGMLSVKFTFPRFSIAGTWKLSHVILSDVAGNTAQLGESEFAQLGVETRLAVRSAKDEMPPVLRLFSFAPARIDTSTRSAAVKAKFAASDDISGVQQIEFVFRGPAGNFQSSGPHRIKSAVSVSGELELAFPRRSTAGQWTLHNVFVADAAGNTLMLETDELLRMGIPTVLEVVSAEDHEPPSLGTLGVSPESVDTTSGPGSVDVSFRAADGTSGVQSITVIFGGPSAGGRLKGSASFPPLNEVTGSVQVAFPRGSEPGEWELLGVELHDAAGNTFVVSGEELRERGLNRVVRVTGVRDVLPPQLVFARFKPETIDAALRAVAVEVEINAADDASGVRSAEIVLVSPTGAARVRGSATIPARTEARATIGLTFPAESEAGDWRVESIVLTDVAGNVRTLSGDEIGARAGRLRVR